MPIILALLSALAYGSSDFIAGWAARRGNAGVVMIMIQPFGFAAAAIALLWFGGKAPGAGTLAWGAVSGLGSGAGTAVLYRGLAVGRMSVVAALSGVVAAVVPAVVGILLGETLPAAVLAGIALAIPAIGLVCWHRGEAGAGGRGVAHGIVAGLAFALLFIALDRAGTASGAWPLVSGQAVAVLIVVPFAWYNTRGARAWRASIRPAIWPCVAAGLLGGAAGLLFLAATGGGALAIVAVITSLYPAATILLARVVLGERFELPQAIGLAAAAVAVALIGAG